MDGGWEEEELQTRQSGLQLPPPALTTQLHRRTRWCSSSAVQCSTVQYQQATPVCQEAGPGLGDPAAPAKQEDGAVQPPGQLQRDTPRQAPPAEPPQLLPIPVQVRV